MKLFLFFFIFIVILLLILTLEVASIKKVSEAYYKRTTIEHRKKILELLNVVLFSAFILGVIKYYKMLDASGLIKRINQEEIIATSVGLTLILFVYKLIVRTSFEPQKQLINL